MCVFAYHTVQINGSDLAMSLFKDLDARREASAIAQNLLCARAGVAPQTYTKWRFGRQSITERNMVRLTNALEALIEEKAA
jgi:transcriptional regulator with XRE-family HTH domain